MGLCNTILGAIDPRSWGLARTYIFIFMLLVLWPSHSDWFCFWDSLGRAYINIRSLKSNDILRTSPLKNFSLTLPVVYSLFAPLPLGLVLSAILLSNHPTQLAFTFTFTTFSIFIKLQVTFQQCSVKVGTEFVIGRRMMVKEFWPEVWRIVFLLPVLKHVLLFGILIDGRLTERTEEGKSSFG